MKTYKRYCLALNEKENEKFNQMKNRGYGIKKIFMNGMHIINPTISIHEIKVDAIVNHSEEE